MELIIGLTYEGESPGNNLATYEGLLGVLINLGLLNPKLTGLDGSGINYAIRAGLPIVGEYLMNVSAGTPARFNGSSAGTCTRMMAAFNLITSCQVNKDVFMSISPLVNHQ